jgi:diaminopimelate decarboxylase
MHPEVSGPPVCGIDFDNTIVTYDELLTTIARERGLIDVNGTLTKRSIRDRIRLLPDGEIEWQKCQALLYGQRIAEAKLVEGVADFIRLCRERGIPVHIVSHKTEFSGYDPTHTNLRTAAMNWMLANHFFDVEGLALDPRDVHFAGTRAEKLDRIRQLACTHFIDDLEETFLEAAFPPNTARILYEPGRQCPAPHGVALMRTWQEIRDYFFSAN